MAVIITAFYYYYYQEELGRRNESGDIVLWPLLHLNFNVLSWPGVHVEVQILIPQVLGEV